jgi:hypothetical protein
VILFLICSAASVGPISRIIAGRDGGGMVISNPQIASDFGGGSASKMKKTLLLAGLLCMLSAA